MTDPQKKCPPPKVFYDELFNEPLKSWVTQSLQERNIVWSMWQPLSGDAGFRRYFRLDTQPALLAVYAPPETEKNAEFVRIAEAWRKQGIHAPAVVAADIERGFMLVEDFGAQSLSDTLEDSPKSRAIGGGVADMSSVTRVYEPVLSALLTLQTAKFDLKLSSYDDVTLKREMALFPEWFVQGLLGLELSQQDEHYIQNAFGWIAGQCLMQPCVTVHRDFHCRNIHIDQQGQIGLIDFQDAIEGPVTYDLVSLLKDCYQYWPKEWIETQALAYRARLPLAFKMQSEAAFLQAFDLMGLQRHIKVLGIFARLALRDHKSTYLSDLPLVIHYVRECLSQHASLSTELEGFYQWFEVSVMPVVAHQNWFSPAEYQG